MSSSHASEQSSEKRPISSHKVIFLGIDFVAKVITLDDGRMIKLQLWDTAGQERFRSLIPAYLRDTAACVVVFDLSSKESFNSVRSWVDQVRDEKGTNGGVEIVLVGNKADMADLRQVSNEEANALAEELGLKYFETSAKSGIDIDEIFTEIAKSIPEEDPVLGGSNTIRVTSGDELSNAAAKSQSCGC
ncbi:RAB6 protein, putative [Perkinsus marinus ATCC 50983]|uniref:RAB6 protein, putative n=1 Tax=Perkinsus marinus (strain ATCC 50983 / TXsc) TaxID=423536 RepID=C5L7N2_PERM5|nr:RAB6 protein, putative [Perkinsus marinus ATCC 50983]EER07494.1 RAB6 protein, putative [Perkinsus marinus ATCC 50983]|eukprot:XP_002775678.1 RAB6 protein, putative [Perkinsus marinus ATCC 50983]